MNAQEIVAANVAARGYMAGWTREQFIARQLAKMQEELGEAVQHVAGVKTIIFVPILGAAGDLARTVFNDKSDWRDVMLIDPDALRAELADMLVVLFAAAQALEFDVVQAAIDKSAVDVARGVR